MPADGVFVMRPKFPDDFGRMAVIDRGDQIGHGSANERHGAKSARAMMTAVGIQIPNESAIAPSALNASKRQTNCTGCYALLSGNVAVWTLMVLIRLKTCMSKWPKAGVDHGPSARSWRRLLLS